MKRMIAIALLLCLLCGCGGREEPPEPAVLTDTVPTTQTSADEGLIFLEPETQPETQSAASAPAVPEDVPYSMVERNDSIRNDNGDVLITILYQRIILDSTGQPQWQNINEAILEDYNRFAADVAYLRETPAEEWEKMVQDMGSLYGNLMATRSAAVTNTEDGILSIRMQQDWFMGGVYNHDRYGLNFDLTTGEPLSLARLSDLPPEAFEDQLKQIVCAGLEKYREILFEDPAAVLESYTLETMGFYLEEGELVLVFPTYTFGPGAMGPTVIETGLYPKLS